MKTRPPGSVRIYDSELHVFEEPERVDSPYERAFLQEVFVPLIRHLRARGWHVGRDRYVHRNYRILSPFARYAVHPSRLEARLRQGGRTIHVNLYQSVCNVDHPAGGQYVHDKLRKMPPQLRRRTVADLLFLASWLCRTFGYRPPQESALELLQGPDFLTNQERRARWKDQHYWSSDDDKIESCNRGTKDGPLHVGERVYFTDDKGRWMTGVAEHGINNMWWIFWGERGHTSKASFELQHRPPEAPRVKCNGALRKDRLTRLMRAAADADKFLRAEQLRRVLSGETDG